MQQNILLLCWRACVFKKKYFQNADRAAMVNFWKAIPFEYHHNGGHISGMALLLLLPRYILAKSRQDQGLASLWPP
jgi:hypothetical protein